jgi:hypothetical protein
MYFDYMGDNPLIEPIYEPSEYTWFEKYPYYGEIWIIYGWSDNGNNYLDFCDWLLIRNIITGEIREVHVEGVETDIGLVEIIPPPPPPGDYEGNNFDNLDDYLPQDTQPLNRQWHEIYPNFCTNWELTSWMDCNESEYVDSCDIVDFTRTVDTAPPQTIVSWEHVIWVGPTIIVEDTTGVAEPESVYFEVIRDTDYFHTGTVEDPVGNWFWEIDPNYSTNHYCVGWIDTNENGIIDFCDWILLQDFDTGEFKWYHVVAVRTDMITEPLFVEAYNFHNTGDYLPSVGDPTGTPWHELYPVYCQNWDCQSWNDNGDGILSVCDTVGFLNTATEAVDTFHVEWIGPTITIEILDLTDVTFYLDILSNDYAEMQPITEPIQTLWFEKYPDYKVDWYITGWTDTDANNELTADDEIALTMVHSPFTTHPGRIVDISTDIAMVRLNDNRDCYEYVPGDANMINGQWPVKIIGGDVTYMVGYFRGINSSCLVGGFYNSGDVNGDCLIIGSDVTRLVSYFRGTASISHCPDYDPCWLTPADTESEPSPDGWPNCETPPATTSRTLNDNTIKPAPEK